MSAPYLRILPLLTDDNRFFWTSGADGKLRFLRCQDCKFWQHPPGPVCTRCLSTHLAPEAVSGKGVVMSFTVNVRPWGPGLEEPYAIALVSLPEQDGLQLTTNILNLAPDLLRIGQPVRVVFEQDDDVWLPLFEPDSAASGGEA
jgi:uncharacterized OB-fold protein